MELELWCTNDPKINKRYAWNYSYGVPEIPKTNKSYAWNKSNGVPEIPKPFTISMHGIRVRGVPHSTVPTFILSQDYVEVRQ